MIVYNRKGFMVAIAVFTAFLLATPLSLEIALADRFFATLMLLISALLNFLLTIVWVRNEEGLSDEMFNQIVETEQTRFKRKFSRLTIKLMRISWDPRSSLFFIRNQVWTFVFLFGALIAFVLETIFKQ
ncbi:hypothetical protein ACFQOY_12135 [Enterococcus alcedinis]|uniref:Uncharacterized protein n=1 Tax=Enterococcus alcedinis TaxID=1274384 RepID=A0A917N4S8_9ENTE|nr:hypothetical protein [Enterococcus alcedinis]MBP2102491.1 hypothetical protein [Enterococcus alcedinis]GGI65973.1 hypothetical protein GCM10011482_16270 [Enterococcus alcedinis]